MDYCRYLVDELHVYTQLMMTHPTHVARAATHTHTELFSPSILLSLSISPVFKKNKKKTTTIHLYGFLVPFDV